MTSGPGAPPLPSPQPPAVAARAITEAARAAADAWALPMEPAEHSRALSQLHSALRDLGIATRGLACYRTTGHPADPAPQGFSQLVAASAERLLAACQNLDGILAAEGLGCVPDPDEPGAMLCQAARTAITAWRQPAGTSAERDTTAGQLIAAIDLLAVAALDLAAYASRRRAIDLRAVNTSLADATGCLSRAIQPARSAQDPKADTTRSGNRE